MTITSDDLRAVLPAVSRDRKAPAALRAVLVERAGDVLRVVATDRHRLVVHERPVTGDDPERALLDPDTLEPVTDASADDFPPYERLLAADPDAAGATADPAALLDTLEAMADDDAPLGVIVENGAVHLGADASVFVDAQYLHDALVAAGGDEVVVEIGGPTSAIAVRSAHVVTILMPVRVATPRRS